MMASSRQSLGHISPPSDTVRRYSRLQCCVEESRIVAETSHACVSPQSGSQIDVTAQHTAIVLEPGKVIFSYRVGNLNLKTRLEESGQTPSELARGRLKQRESDTAVLGLMERSGLGLGLGAIVDAPPNRAWRGRTAP